MPYGILKVDQVTFTNAGVDQTISVSGIVASISGNITATGTISGNVIRGGTLVSGATVTGTAGQFGTITGNTAGFTTVTGTTVTGTTAQFTTVTGGTAGFTTVTGTTVTGTTANFVTVSGTTVTGNVGNFTTVTGGTVTLTSGVFGAGTASLPSISFTSDPNTGIYSPGADQVAISTNGAQRVTVDSSGRCLVGTSSGSALLQVNGTFRAGDQATSGMTGNNATILSATPPSGALAAEIHCFGKDYSTAGANNHVGLLVAYWSADTNTINTTTNINNSTGANQGFEVIWSSPNLVVRNKTSMSATQSARAWIRWLA